jgi:CRISPR system Cascade subunit CasA
VASGNNVPLFSARTDADPPVLSPAQAARAVLSAHCWDTAAIKSGAVGDHQMRAGKTTGNPTGPLGQLGVVTPMGSSLFETLMLSVPTLPQGFQRADRPQWATDDPPDANWDSGRQPAGLLDLLTWQARRVRLVVGDENSGDEIGISRVVLCAGDRIGVLPHDVEPHTGWKRVDRPKAGESPQRPDRHQPGRSAWRGLAALIATKEPTSEHKSAPTAMNHVAGLRLSGVLPDEFPLRALLVGVVYGNQAAVIEDVIVDVLPLPMLALLDQDANDVRDMLLAVVGQAEQLRLAANHLGDDLRAATGVEKLPWDKGQRLGEVLVHLFDPSVRRLLAGLQRHPGDAERAELAWRLVARRLAWSVAEPALNAVPATTFLGRGLDERYPARVATAEAKFRRRLTDILGPAQPTVAA